MPVVGVPDQHVGDGLLEPQHDGRRVPHPGVTVIAASSPSPRPGPDPDSLPAAGGARIQAVLDDFEKTSLSLVRYRRNDYSVPTAYGHRDVVVKGYVDVVVIVCGSEEIARHRRSYGREELIFDPLHYLALLERKTGALDQAAPLTGWALPDEFLRLRRLLETRLGKAGTREYVQVLRLLEDFRLAHVRGAIEDALRLGAIGFDAVKHLVLCRLDHRPPRLDLVQYPHLPAPRVTTTLAADYLMLLGAGAE